MEQLKVIERKEVLDKDFRVYGTEQEPLFLARDVAEWIEHSNPTEMLRVVDEDEKLSSTILSAGQRRNVTLLTEDGLYEVLMQSRKPIAKKFKKEIKVILKELRLNGKYQVTDDPFKAMKLSMQVMEKHEERIEYVENKVVHLENEVKLDPGEYNYLTSHISRNVRQAIQSFGFANTREVKKELFRDINRGLNDFCEVATRTQLKQKHFDKAMEYIQIWVPSTSTKLKVQQLSMDLDKEG